MKRTDVTFGEIFDKNDDKSECEVLISKH